MTQILTKLAIGRVAAILLAAFSACTIGGAVARHIAPDGFTNRYEPPQSESQWRRQSGLITNLRR
jgi:hypothetical protein